MSQYVVLFPHSIAATFDPETLTWASDEEGWSDLLNKYLSWAAVSQLLRVGEGEMPPAFVCLSRAREQMQAVVITQPSENVDPAELAMGLLQAIESETPGE